MDYYNGKDRREGWVAWQDLILNEIKDIKQSSSDLHKSFDVATASINTRIDAVNSSMQEKIDNVFIGHIVPMKQEIAGLKVKAGLWGAVAGAIPVVIAVALMLIKSRLPEAAALSTVK